jgi:hypothetical protein
MVNAVPALRLRLTCVVAPKPRAPTNKRKALDLTEDGADLDDDLWCQRCVRALGVCIRFFCVSHANPWLAQSGGGYRFRML